MKNDKKIPTPYAYAGGVEKFERLTEVFYEKVLKDELLEPLFRNMAAEHAKHVAHFMVKVLMGPPFYSEEFGEDSLKRMVCKHIGKYIREEQRKRWVDLLLQSADETGIPDDPEFRSTFVAHLEWGSRVALINSQLASNPTTGEEQIPQWGWGEVKGPYEIVGSLFQKKHKEE
ncbi:MAG TPA: group II truncated hemoglobin [Chitinophaga sp.]|uniref:group II truncated hemoglobin n=1 Tax=Chitinophaga sp. TaxID=1869181 RepID=UPI002C32FC6F|nr:group II truncated hemoglobin [Chitinophaga sp.]HVI44348.1 group II truncated hemoglobin [Chitinophaga sp.]